MKTFRFDGPDSGVYPVHLPIPEPGEGQVLIAVKAAGLCHSDAHFLTGHEISTGLKLPITLGHEVAGTVVKLGPGPSVVQIGDHVAVALLSHPAEQADWTTAIGLGYDGGYGEYALAHNDHLVKIPENVSFPEAAVATDSISTAYHAVLSTAQVTSSTTVAILGIGGLGMNAVMIAALQGAKVYGVDLNTAKYEDAKRCGTIACATTLEAFANVTFDVIIDFVGTTSTISTAISAVKISGTIVVVGLASSTFEIRSSELVVRSITLKGSLGASKTDLLNVLDLISTGKISPKLVEIPFDDVPNGLKALAENKVEGRLFTRPCIE
ncbi:GroES-like protein [Camillea tinctor]|nr:GroES-like protein [Camillea tinctor]